MYLLPASYTYEPRRVVSKYAAGKKKKKKKKDEVDDRNVGMLVTTGRNAEMQNQDRNKCQHLV